MTDVNNTQEEHEEEPENSALAAARDYTRRGWRVVPVVPGQKGVAIVRWQEMRLEEDELPKWFGAVGGGRGGLHHNIGVLLGEPSGGLVDVDCDAREAALAAAELLPATGLVSGRAGNPASHYWYRIEGELPATAKFGDVGAGSVAKHAMLIELRSTGQQTVVPPSAHPSGETLRWERGSITQGDLGVVSARDLRAAVARVAAVALLARHWPGEGQRDEAAKDLAGLLLRGGWAEEEVDDFMRLVARIAGDEEWRKRGKARHTAQKLAEGGEVTGGPTLAGRLAGNAGDGERIVAQVRDWLGLKGLGSAQMLTTPKSAQRGAMSAYSAGMVSDDDVGHPWSITASEVEHVPLRWLWRGRIPLGAITLLDGDPGLGKSLLTIDLAARVTRGRVMPDLSPGVAGGVVLLSAEDNPASTIRPRLEIAAADTGRVELLRGVLHENAETGQTHQRPFLLPHDLPILESVVQRVGAKLVVIDPLMAYLDTKVNSWRDQDVRAMLAPLAALAERTGAAILILRHLNKASGMQAVYRGGGSIGIIGAARSGLLVAKSPDNPDHERVLASTKSNLGPPMPSLRYQLTAVLAQSGGLEGEGIEYLREYPKVEWLGECEMNAAQLLAASGEEANDSLTRLEETKQWLRATLAEGEMPSRQVEHAAVAAGLAVKTLRTAREALEVVIRQIGFSKEKYTTWRLPAPAPESAPSLPITPIAAHSAEIGRHDNDGQTWVEGTDGTDEGDDASSGEAQP
jgi:hypothetical protein